MFSIKTDWQNKFSAKKAVYFWYRHYKLLLVALFLIVLGFGTWAWYASLHKYSWNDEQKKKFLDSYVRETNFKEAKFYDVVERMKRRATLHEEPPAIKKNIFTGRDY